ncbi:SDR family NAD(P)-dependent oxidoreductase [Paenibacillus hodogayensis]|uniref:SDR family NAD(P)-dependent oxidoreductase n=1 Tax=Paenibacillus hodogayensis TaxID=279208 RepID=A0ABV5VRG9_9BACL
MLQEKTILITGALGQLGRSAVPMFLGLGANVMASDVVPIEQAPRVAALKEQYGEDRFRFIQSDAADENQVKALMEETERSFGRLDGLYCNAYKNVWKPILQLSLEEWEETMTGTLTSTFLCCKYALPLMIRSGGGSIVNTSSVLSHIPKSGCASYGAAKAGVNQLTRVIAKDYADSNIRANALLPGDFKSDERLASMSDAQRESIGKETLLGRSGRADEINQVAAFLLSDAASYVTGSLYTVDGGFHL